MNTLNPSSVLQLTFSQSTRTMDEALTSGTSSSKTKSRSSQHSYKKVIPIDSIDEPVAVDPELRVSERSHEFDQSLRIDRNAIQLGKN